MIQFTVYGHPEPQGSTRAFIPKGWKRPIITSANKKQKPWRQEVARMAIAATGDHVIIIDKKGHPHGVYAIGAAISACITFFLRKPPSVSNKRVYPVAKPDLDKLVRSILDSCTGIIFRDDSQVVTLAVRKRFGSPERVEVEFQEEGK